MTLNLRVSLHCFSRLFPSSVFIRQSPGAVGGSLCPGAGTGLGFAKPQHGQLELWERGRCPGMDRGILNVPTLSWQWVV